jgi:hypothetical protein
MCFHDETWIVDQLRTSKMAVFIQSSIEQVEFIDRSIDANSECSRE